MKCSECGEEIIDEECLCTNPDDAPPIDDEGELLDDFSSEEDFLPSEEEDDF